MADSFVSKLITELTAKTTAVDTDLVPIADSNGNFFKMTWQKMKQLLLGTKDISSVGDGTVAGAISELNTKLLDENLNKSVYVTNELDDMLDSNPNKYPYVFGHSTKLGSKCGYWIIVMEMRVKSTDQKAQLAIGQNGMASRFYQGGAWSDWI